MSTVQGQQRIWAPVDASLAWAQYHPGNEACCLQGCSLPNLAVGLRDRDMLSQTPHETGQSSTSAGSWAFPGRTESPTRSYFAVPACEVLRSWSWRPNSDGLVTGWERRTAVFQNRSVPNWLAALAGREARQSATKTPSRTLIAPVTSLLKAESISKQIVVLEGWQPTTDPKPSRKGDCQNVFLFFFAIEMSSHWVQNWKTNKLLYIYIYIYI